MVQSKATRKFEKKHLQDSLKRRREVAKLKLKKHMRQKRKERIEKDGEKTVQSGYDKKDAGVCAKETVEQSAVNPMSADEFFQGGSPSQILQDGSTKLGKRKKRSKTVDQKVDGLQKTVTKEKVEKATDYSVFDSMEEEEDEEEDEEDDDGRNDEGSCMSNDSDNSDELEEHKRQLEELEKKDPEFYKFLKESDAELLDFDSNADMAMMDCLSNSEDGPSRKTSKKASKDAREENRGDGGDDNGEEDALNNEVSIAMVEKWRTAMADQQSLRAMREAILAFRAAAHINDTDGEDEKDEKYSISSPDVYSELLVATLNHVPDVLHKHLPVKVTVFEKSYICTESKKYRSLAPLLKSHGFSITRLLKTLSDPFTLRLTLSSLLPLLPYLLSFKKLIRNLSRAVSDVWSDSSKTEATRICAFLVLRRLVVIGDSGIKQTILKSTYQGLLKASRSTTVHSLPHLNLMKNSAAELWGLDQTVGYTTGFTFIRQLAIHLRSSITKNSDESFKLIYNWQYVQSLDFWSRVLATHCNAKLEAELGVKESALHPLIYPMVQISLGAARLIPTPQYFPLRFLMVRLLLRISVATGTYIPLAPILIEVLCAAEMKKLAKPSTLATMDFSVAIHAPKSYLHTKVYQDGVGDQIIELLTEFFVIWTKSIAFPELVLPVTIVLKRWLRDATQRGKSGNGNRKINGAISVLVQKLEENSRWIEERRARIQFSPKERAEVDNFLSEDSWEKSPFGAYAKGQRAVRKDKERVLEEGMRAEERKAMNKEKKEKDCSRGVAITGAWEDGPEKDVEDEFNGFDD